LFFSTRHRAAKNKKEVCKKNLTARSIQRPLPVSVTKRHSAALCKRWHINNENGYLAAQSILFM